MNHLSIRAEMGALRLHVRARFQQELVVISGENGAGKSTLLRCVAGLQACGGQICIGEQVWLDSAAGFVYPVEQRCVGFVWSDAVLLPWLNVQENIVLAVSDQDAGWLAQVCEALDVYPLLQRKPCMLSTGEAQRVSLARAMYMKPSLLLLDEPFSAQAPEIRGRLRQALRALQHELDIPVLMVSHDKEDARVLAQQHWYMREGKLTASASGKTILAADARR